MLSEAVLVLVLECKREGMLVIINNKALHQHGVVPFDYDYDYEYEYEHEHDGTAEPDGYSPAELVVYPWRLGGAYTLAGIQIGTVNEGTQISCRTLLAGEPPYCSETCSPPARVLSPR